MAHSYFNPHPQRSRRQRSSSPSPSGTDTPANMRCRQSRDNPDEPFSGDLEQSIFIFPNPLENAMLPPDIVLPPWWLHEQQMRRGRRVSNASRVTSDWCSVSGLSGRSASVGSPLPSPLVEVWEMSDDGRSLSHVDTEVEFEGDVELGRTFTFEEILRRRQQRFPLARQPRPSDFYFEDGRFQFGGQRSWSAQRSRSRSARRLLRTRSRSRSQRRASSALPSAKPTSELSRTALTLPLFHLLSYLLAIDESTHDLLNRSSSHAADSPLFAGHRLQPVSEEPASSEQLVHENTTPRNQQLVERKETHAAPQLSEVKAASESLKAGLAAVMDDSVASTSTAPVALLNPYPFPLFTLPFTYLWRSVGSVFASSSTKPRKHESSVPA